MITFHKEHDCQDCDTISETYVKEVHKKSIETKLMCDSLNAEIMKTESMLQQIDGEEQVYIYSYAHRYIHNLYYKLLYLRSLYLLHSPPIFYY